MTRQVSGQSTFVLAPAVVEDMTHAGCERPQDKAREDRLNIFKKIQNVQPREAPVSTVSCALCVYHYFPQLSHVSTKTPAHVQGEAARDVIRRLVLDRASDFEVKVDQNMGPRHRDTFKPPSSTPFTREPEYIRSAGSAVYKGMIAGDPDAVWLMQGWLFLDPFWQAPQVKALVTSVPIGRMIVLDLASELSPVFSRFESYYGQPFIWCMIHNFGGTNVLYGAVEQINVGPFHGRRFPNSSMVGIGLTPEGINQNEVMYEFMLENAWRTEPRDVDQWSVDDGNLVKVGLGHQQKLSDLCNILQSVAEAQFRELRRSPVGFGLSTNWVVSFARQRYGADNTAVTRAWRRLISSVYNSTKAHFDFNNVLITKRPSTSYDVGSDIWYKPRDLFQAWEGFVNASPDLAESQLFQYDVTDVTRNSLQVISLYHYYVMMSAFQGNDPAGVQAAGAKISELLTDMDLVLSANDRFLVGRCIADAKSWATDADEMRLLEYNARNQITLISIMRPSSGQDSLQSDVIAISQALFAKYRPITLHPFF
ncbi:alpha-N-acetylglucosaminidase-like [Aplysia californica]|uniref:Alpha-N-acetylglucosaminidase-like n=1 Tax=Aplysia californica TaxID=6500 RepID=A0ABM1A9H8_APLCA|nr:alpha-N-acetylglucosaminidase-like [Aplysia californica]